MPICASDVLLKVDSAYCCELQNIFGQVDSTSRISDLYTYIYKNKQQPLLLPDYFCQWVPISNTHTWVSFSVFSVTFVLHDPPDYLIKLSKKHF